MAEVGRNTTNTVAKAPITFAMIELADSADCNTRKSQWLSYGFKDVTPMFGKQSSVPSLNGGMVAKGRDMLTQMKDVSADWYMVSGHHGAIYGTDYGLFTTNGAPDGTRVVNEEQYCGFFNEAYHESYWEHATRTDHDPAKLPGVPANAIYVRTTDAAPESIAAFDQDNPLFDATSWAPAPKGIILSACNTLVYRSARRAWCTYFPNAVIIGPGARIASGTWVANAIAGAAMTNEAFWRDPQSILDQPGMCAELEKQLAQNFPRKKGIALIYKSTLYLADGRSMPADSPITPK